MTKFFYCLILVLSFNLFADQKIIEIPGTFSYETLRSVNIRCGWEHVMAPLWRQVTKTEPVMSVNAANVVTSTKIAENGRPSFRFLGKLEQNIESNQFIVSVLYQHEGMISEILQVRNREGLHDFKLCNKQGVTAGRLPYLEFYKKITKLKVTESGEILEFEAVGSGIILVTPYFHSEHVYLQNQKTGALSSYELDTVAYEKCIIDALK